MYFRHFFRSFLIPALIVLLIYGTGLTVRRIVLAAQYEKYGRDLPFTLESALQFRYVRMLFNGEGLPSLDRKVQAPDGIAPRETYTIGAEYIYATAARLLPRHWTLADRVRWISVLWFCLGIPGLYLWLYWRLGSHVGTALGAAYYAVGLAAVMRSTGQELSHENFALPLLMAHLAAEAGAERSPRLLFQRSAQILSALLLGAALACWDLIQYYVWLWMLLQYYRLIKGRHFTARHNAVYLAIMTLTLEGTCLINPYLRSHGCWLAPQMLLGLGTTLSAWVQHMHPIRPRWLSIITTLIPPVLMLTAALTAHIYFHNYNHFGELLLAKLRFLNQKPENPALLTFNQRILWAPALNSANWRLTYLMFPAIIPVVWWAMGLWVFSHCRSAEANSETDHWFFYCVITAPAFWLFMRFHVFMALFAAALLGWLGRQCAKQAMGWLRAALLALLWASVTAEGVHTIAGAARWGATPAYWEQQKELLNWLRANTAEETVLANFGLSASLLAYGDFPVVLHPKFESPVIRQRVEEYCQRLFKGNEKEFRDWADKLGVQYYIYALGEFADRNIDLQLRYCADALQPPPEAPARIFEYRPSEARYFQLLWDNTKYRVFRMITRQAEEQAATLAAASQAYYKQGAVALAEETARLALVYDPHNTNAMRLLKAPVVPSR